MHQGDRLMLGFQAEAPDEQFGKAKLTLLPIHAAPLQNLATLNTLDPIHHAGR
jgi:hypothetical protein